jgi:hypothetical protein
MWQLQNPAVNTLIATLQEKLSSTSNYILVVLTSQQTGNSQPFIPSTWTSDERKDILTVTLGGANVPAAGLLDFPETRFPAGWYDYAIYEQTDETNIDPEDQSILQVIERGVAYLVLGGVAFGETTYTSYDNDGTGYTYYTE